MTEREFPEECSSLSFGIPTSTGGIGFGNSRNFSGFRLNFSDCGIEKINGINITLMWPMNNPNSEINGITFGLVGPGAAKINGISVAGIGMQAKEAISGISYSTFASSSEGAMSGLQFAGLALVAKGKMTGLSAAGFGIDCYNKMEGINIGGIGLVSSKGMTGINIGGFAAVSDGDVTGINFAGFALYSFNDITGLNLSATISSYNTTGLSASLYHSTENSMKGISISLINYAVELYGVQIGLINIAENNPSPLKVLPFINVHLK